MSDVESVEIMEKITLAESARQCGNVDLAMKILIEALRKIMIRQRRQEIDKMRNRGEITKENHKEALTAIQSECTHEWKVKTEPRGSGWITSRFCELCGKYEAMKQGGEWP